MKVLKAIQNIVVYTLALIGLLTVILFIYSYPVLDRVFFNSCSYYPEAFIEKIRG